MAKILAATTVISVLQSPKSKLVSRRRVGGESGTVHGCSDPGLAWVRVPIPKLQYIPRDVNRRALVLLSVRLFVNVGTLIWDIWEDVTGLKR